MITGDQIPRGGERRKSRALGGSRHFGEFDELSESPERSHGFYDLQIVSAPLSSNFLY
jgi:hypothetical protein